LAPAGYVLDTTIKKYVKCDVSCLTCIDTQIKCTKCNQTSFYYGKVDNANSCYLNNNSPSGYYFNLSTKIHEKCSVNCLTCINNLDSCTSCNNAGGYYDPVDNLNVCFNVAPTGYVLDSKINKYIKCDVTCFSCLNTQSNCSQCNQAQFYYPRYDSLNTCILMNNSPSGYYYNNTSNKHEKCDISCLTCTITKVNCISCNTVGGYYNTLEKPETCLSSPPLGYFLNTEKNQYSKCDISCNGCTLSPLNCSNCNQANSNYLLNYYSLVTNANSCFLIQNTPLGFYYDSKSNKFQKCDVSCKTCEKYSTFCLSCNEKYLSLQTDPSNCVMECPEKTWINLLKKECSLCNESCKKCNDDSKSCLECDKNYFPLEDNRSLCYLKCPVGYILNDKVEDKFCKKCSTYCESCDLNDNCLLCTLGYFLNKIDNKCYSKCNSGYYPESISRTCVQCIQPCLECSNNNICLSCIKDFYMDRLLSQNNCVKTCSEGYWPNNANNTCDFCDTKCKLCISKEKCQSCRNEFFFIQDLNACVINCPINNYYSFENISLALNPSSIKINQSLKTCEKCALGCLICRDSADNCISCDNGYFFISAQNKCISKCPENFYPDYNLLTCNRCDISCKSCKGPSANDCLSCDLQTGFSIQDGYCTKGGCPNGQILLENKKCLNLSKCIEMANLLMPKIFNLEMKPFIAKFVYKINNSCEEYKKNFCLKWDEKSSLYEKAIKSNDNLTYTIMRDDMLESEISLKINIYFDDFYLGNFNQTSIILLNKVFILLSLVV